MRSPILAVALLLALASPLRADGPCLGDRKIVAYYIEWAIYGRNYQPADTPLDKITHLNYAFANVGPDLKIQVGDSYAAIDKYYPGDTWNQPFRGTYNQFNNVLRALHPHIKTFISVGGWTWSGRFSDVALTAQSRQTFAASCVAFIRQYHFDGVDLDWEYPVCCGLAGNTYRPEDKHNFTLLLQEMRQQLNAAGVVDGRRYLLTIAAPAGHDKIANIEMDQIAQHLDWINVMCYDFFGAWDLNSTGHHGGFNANPAAPFSPLVRERYNTTWAMNAWLGAGVPASKLTIGVPFYGHAWGGVSAANNGLFRPGTFIPPARGTTGRAVPPA